MNRKFGCENMKKVKRLVMNIKEPNIVAQKLCVCLRIINAIPITPKKKFVNTYIFEMTSGVNPINFNASKNGTWNTIPPNMTAEVSFILLNICIGLKYGDALSAPIIMKFNLTLRIINTKAMNATINIERFLFRQFIMV